MKGEREREVEDEEESERKNRYGESGMRKEDKKTNLTPLQDIGNT